MMFPDCRNDDVYNQAFLDGKNKKIIRGYDFAAETVDNFFDNPEFLDNDKIMRFFDKILPEDMQDEYDMEFSVCDESQKSRKVITYGDYIRMKMLSWLEMQRNELITSMIDDMDDDLYDAIQNKMYKDNPDADYYDTRRYLATGDKVSS